MALDRVDKVVLSILDEQGKDRLKQAPEESFSPEKAAQIIWGPYRFVPNAPGTIDPHGRSAQHGPIVRGGQNDSLLQFLERTPARSRNTTTKMWRDHYAEKPIRLSATCTRDGYKPWTQLFEFPVEPK